MEQNISERVSTDFIPGADRAHIADPRDGVIQIWVESSLGVAEETLRASFGLLDDIRSETQERIGATIDWVEGFDRSAFRLARRALERANGVGTRALSTSQSSWYALFSVVRRTARATTSLVFETTVSIVGERKPSLPLS